MVGLKKLGRILKFVHNGKNNCRYQHNQKWLLHCCAITAIGSFGGTSGGGGWTEINGITSIRITETHIRLNTVLGVL